MRDINNNNCVVVVAKQTVTLCGEHAAKIFQFYGNRFECESKGFHHS